VLMACFASVIAAIYMEQHQDLDEE
ncbi:MAG TPA: cytochrome bd-I oxidase subunit CydX, partial [Acinetobacter schindleri]|nr:cytochrome bd-I oxidase subunit CydX [Acinetobacter schindleri]